jgi:hypothetical protein
MAPILTAGADCDDDGVHPDTDRPAGSAPDPAMPDMPRDPVRTRGRYSYLRDGEPMAVEERFVLGDLDDATVRVRATRVSATPVSRLEVDARITATGTEVQVRWTGSTAGSRARRGGGGECERRAGAHDAHRRGDGVRRGRRRGRALPPHAGLHGGARALLGRAPHSVVVPDIADPADGARFLAPVVSERTAQVLGERSVLVGGVERAGTAYRWVGGAYPDGAEFVVDDGGLLLEYAVAQDSGRWQVTLSELTGPWPAPLTWPTATP